MRRSVDETEEALNVVICYPMGTSADWDPMRAEFADDEFTWTAELEASFPALREAEVIGSGRPLGPGVLDAAPNVRWVQVFSAGVEEYLKSPGLLERDLVLTNVKVVLGSHVAETGIALLTGLSRGIAPAVLAQQEERWDPSIQVDELTGKRALVVGAGGIGRALARRLDGLEVEVRAVDIYPQEPDAYIREVRLVSEMADMLPETDILAICCPSTAETQRLIDANVFDLLPDDAYLINISRGAVVDTPALVDALRSGKLRGAGLDVLDQEPPPAGHPIWGFPNVMITPHNGGASPLRVARIREFFASNLHRYKAGEPLENVVDVEAGF